MLPSWLRRPYWVLAAVAVALAACALLPRPPIETESHVTITERLSPHAKGEPQAERATTPQAEAATTPQADAPPRPVKNPWAPPDDPQVPPPPQVRNPWAPPLPAHSGSPRRTVSLQLLGILVGDSGRTALVRIGSNVHMVHVGTRLGPWTVVEFNCRPPFGSDIVVRRDDRVRRLALVPVTAEAGVPRRGIRSDVRPQSEGTAPGPPPPQRVPIFDDHTATPFPNEPPEREPPVDPRDFDP